MGFLHFRRRNPKLMLLATQQGIQIMCNTKNFSQYAIMKTNSDKSTDEFIFSPLRFIANKKTFIYTIFYPHSIFFFFFTSFVPPLLPLSCLYFFITFSGCKIILEWLPSIIIEAHFCNIFFGLLLLLGFKTSFDLDLFPVEWKDLLVYLGEAGLVTLFLLIVLVLLLLLPLFCEVFRRV